MTHKDEAKRLLADENLTLRERDGSDYLYRANALATLALVDAQEAANEQARIGNLVALASSGIHEVIGDPSFDPATEALMNLVHSFPTAMDDEAYGFAPNIAAALGIGEANEQTD